MKRILLVALLAVLAPIQSMLLFGQEFNEDSHIKDVKNARWGMSQNELLEAERLIDKRNRPKVEDNTVTFEAQDIGNGFEADIRYKFLAGRLISVQYKVYYVSDNVRGTCKNVISFKDKVQYTEHIFKELETEKEMRCFRGWFYNDTVNLRDYTYKPDDDYNCKRDGKVLVRLNELAVKHQHNKIYVEFSNTRTKALVTYNEWQNNKDAFLKELGRTPACEDDIYKYFFTIKFEPRSNLKESISNTAMSIEDLEGEVKTDERIETEATEEKKDKKSKEGKKNKDNKNDKKSKKKDKADEDEPLKPAEVIEALPEGAELPDSLDDSEKEDKKSKDKSKKDKKAKKSKKDKKGKKKGKEDTEDDPYE